jgi:hypothetical protein
LRTTVAAVCEDFIRDKLPSERASRDAERDIRRELLPPWSNKPITEITDLDVLTLVRAKKAKGPVAARNLLNLIRRMFDWALDQRTYGLTVNPCANLRPSKIIGEKVRGVRILTDDELFALWRSAALRVRSVTLDGEGVVCGRDGVSDFELLREAVSRKGSGARSSTPSTYWRLTGPICGAAPGTNGARSW